MLVTIQTVSQEFTKTGAEYRKVMGISGDGKETTKSVFDNLQDKWPLLKENATLEFKMVKKGQFWNVVDITELTLPSPTSPAGGTIPTSQAVITREASIETQVAIKEVGEGWRVDKFKDNEPEVLAYRAWILDKLNGYMKGAKDVKATKELPDEETIPRDTRVDDTGGGGKTFKDVGALMNWYHSHGDEFTFGTFVADLEVTKPSDVTDLNKAYQVLKGKYNWED